MQFAGQRTDVSLNPIGEPVNILVALSEDVLPDPAAVLVTGITPQQTRAEGYSEADFLRYLYQHVITPGTVMLGFNSVRFDDEFMRYTLYRNFYDPYQWQWQDARSRWDMLDVVRMTRALRPDGIAWPFDEKGNPTNRLELLSSKNGLDHAKAHDALSDVLALIAMTKLIKQRQPKLFDYLFDMRHKKKIAELVNLDQPQPFVYTSGRYPKEVLHTTVALPFAPGGKPGSTLVYDLRHDPTHWAGKTIQELKTIRFAPYDKRKEPDFRPLPAKELAYNRCPAVAPLGVLDAAAQERLSLDLGAIEKHLSLLNKSDLTDKLREVFTSNDFAKSADVDAQLYDGFINQSDAYKMAAIRAAEAEAIADFRPDFTDERLQQLLVRYKARNYPQSLSGDERLAWEEFRAARLANDLPAFMKQLQQYSKTANDKQQFLLQELHLWAESVMPTNG